MTRAKSTTLSPEARRKIMAIWGMEMFSPKESTCADLSVTKRVAEIWDWGKREERPKPDAVKKVRCVKSARREHEGAETLD